MDTCSSNPFLFKGQLYGLLIKYENLNMSAMLMEKITETICVPEIISSYLKIIKKKSLLFYVHSNLHLISIYIHSIWNQIIQ